MKKLISYRVAQDIDAISQERYAIPDIVLMEQAGALLTRILEQEIKKTSATVQTNIQVQTQRDVRDRENKREKICILCGSGNNAGDALVLARSFFNKGYKVYVSFLSEVKSRLANVQKDMIIAMGCPIVSIGTMNILLATLGATDWIIDGIAGVGINRVLKYTECIALVNASEAKVLSVDVPSGMLEQWVHAQEKTLSNTVIKADVTVSFGFAKAAMYYPQYRSSCGNIIVTNPHFPQQVLDEAEASAYLMEEADIVQLVPVMSQDVYKRSRGVLLMAAGSKETPGAACLVARSAAKSFAGMVYAVLDDCVSTSVNSMVPSVITGLELSSIKKPHAVLFGPGWGTYRDIGLVISLLDMAPIAVVDADGLSYLKQLPLQNQLEENSCPQLVLTPHQGEMTMLDEEFIEHANLWQSASVVSKRYNAVVVAKQSVSAVVYQDLAPLIIDGRNPALAKAGSGDVLSGILASYVAYCLSSAECIQSTLSKQDIQKHVAVAVYMHAKLAQGASPYCSSAEGLMDKLDTMVEIQE